MIMGAPFPLTICLYPLYSDKNSLNKTVFVKQSAWEYINFSTNSANYFTNYWYVHIRGPEDRLPDSTCQHNKTALPLPDCNELRSSSFLKYEFCKRSATIMNNFYLIYYYGHQAEQLSYTVKAERQIMKKLRSRD